MLLSGLDAALLNGAIVDSEEATSVGQIGSRTSQQGLFETGLYLHPAGYY